MYRFNYTPDLCDTNQTKFQYFKCIGLIIEEVKYKDLTIPFQYFKCIGLIIVEIKDGGCIW